MRHSLPPCRGYATLPWQAQAQQALRKLLLEPMVFEPVVAADGKKAYRITGKTRVGALLDPSHIGMASPRGVEPLSPP